MLRCMLLVMLLLLLQVLLLSLGARRSVPWLAAVETQSLATWWTKSGETVKHKSDGEPSLCC